MTLVVAERVHWGVRILSDTAVSNREAVRAESIPGVLKAVVLSARTCIAFAGRIHGGYDVIRRIARESRPAPSLKEIAGQLLEHNRETGDATEFILAHEEHLLKIGDGKIYQGSNRYWVGEADAASSWQRCRDGWRSAAAGTSGDALKDEGNNGFVVSELAFLDVLEDSQHPSVRGLPFVVERARDGHRYRSGIGMTTSQAIGPEDTILLESGGPESGGFSYTYVVTKQAGLPIVAVYFPPGRVGFVYNPLESDDALTYRAGSLRDFITVVSDKYGVELWGMHVT
jgi:hypothetical protein